MEIPNDVLSGDGFEVWIAVDGSPCAQYGMEYEEAMRWRARRSAAGLRLRQIRCVLVPSDLSAVDISCFQPFGP